MSWLVSFAGLRLPIAGHQVVPVLSFKAIQSFNAGSFLPVFLNRFKDIG